MKAIMKVLFYLSTFLFGILALFNLKNDSNFHKFKVPDFNKYISQFEEKDLPFNIDESVFFEYDEEDIDNLPDLNYIEWDEMDFLPFASGRYSRMGPDDYTYEANLAISDDFKTVIVGGKRPFSNIPHYYTIVTYSNKGVVIDHQNIASFWGKNEMTRAYIQDGGLIISETCSNEWEGDDLVAVNLIESNTFTISADGKIDKLDLENIPVEQETTSLPEDRVQVIYD